MRLIFIASLVSLIVGGSLTATVRANEQQELRVTPQTAHVDRLGDPLPARALMRFGTRRFQHPSGPTQIILSADEQTVVTLMRDTLFGWDAESGKELWRQPLENSNNGIIVGSAAYGVRPLARLPDSTKIAFAHLGGVSTIDPVSGETESLLEIAATQPKSIDISPDGTLIAIGDASELTVLTRNGKTVWSIPNKPAEPLNDFRNIRDRLKFGGDYSYARFSPDGKHLALVNSEKPETIRVLGAATGDLLCSIQGQAHIVRMEFSPDSQQIAATERDIAVRLYNVTTAERVWELLFPQAGQSESYTSAVSFRPDGQQIAVGAPLGSDHRIRLVDPITGTETGSLSGIEWKPWTLCYTKDGQSLYGSGWDGVIRRWNLTTNEQLPLPGGVRATGICAMSRDGNHLAFADDNKDIHLCRLPDGQTDQTFNRPKTAWHQVVFSQDGSRLAAGGSTFKDIHVVVWDLKTSKVLHEWSWAKGPDSHSKVEALSFSRNGNRLSAAVFRQGMAYVWDLPSNSQLAGFEHREIYGLDINADGSRLITAGWDKHIRDWDCDAGLLLQDRDLKEEGKRADTRMYGVKLSNDESLIATIDMTNAIRFFDRQLNTVSTIPQANSFSYGALQFSRNDLWVAVGGRNGVRVFDVASGVSLWEADDHENNIYTVDFGANDRMLLSGGEDGICYLWDLGAHGPMDHELAVLGDELFGDDAAGAFSAFVKLSTTPDATTELLRRKLSTVPTEDIPDAEFRKALTALGAPRGDLASKAQQQFSEWGPAGYERLMQEADAGRLPEKKMAYAESLGKTLSARYTRAIALLASLDSPKVDEVIDQLLETTTSPLIRDPLEKAAARRQR